MSDSDQVFPPDLPTLTPMSGELVPQGAKGEKLIALAPTYAVAAPAKNDKKAPLNEKFAAERVALLAKEQLECPEPFEKIEARRINDDTYRVNWLAVDVGQNDKKVTGFGLGKAVQTGQKTKDGELVVKTWVRVYSRLVKVRWGKTVILSALPGKAQPE
jgi:hypothetical protein